MQRKIIINQKEYTMPKMSVDTYMDYLELAEQVDAERRYTKQGFEAMMLFICRVYGNQFTVEELKDTENGIDAAGIVMEFQMIDMDIAKEIESRADKILKNFQNGK